MEFPIDVTEFGTDIVPRLLHPLNTLFPIVAREVGSSILVKDMQFSNVESPIDVTEFGTDIVLRLVHPLNALFPIVTREVGSSIFTKEVQLSSAESPIVLIVSVIFTSFNFENPENAELPILLISPSCALNSILVIVSLYSFHGGGFRPV